MCAFRHEKKFVLSSRKSSISSWFILIILVTAIIGCLFYFFLRKQDNGLPSLREIYKDWDARNYSIVYDKTTRILDARPLDGTALSLHGFAAYYLSVEHADSTASQEFLNESIISLRNAWNRVSELDKKQIAYVLGKAYYQRGFYYADLSLKFLDIASDANKDFSDLEEFRGMTAALLGDFEKSTSSFLIALANKPSDLLLFALAQNYLKTDNFEKARQFLHEAIRTTNDDLLLMKCKYELGVIFLKENALEQARIEFESILEKDPNYADAHYGLGVVYEAMDDMIKARAEWRKTLKSNPIHTEARSKLNI